MNYQINFNYLFGFTEFIITFVPMSKDLLRKRHLDAVIKLQSVANPKVFLYGLMKCAKAIGDKLEITDQTVINYLSGRVKDGFLTEAIAKEFKALKL